MKKTEDHSSWLTSLSTRELVIYLMELRKVRTGESLLAPEVDHACAALRDELRRREWPVTAR